MTQRQAVYRGLSGVWPLIPKPKRRFSKSWTRYSEMIHREIAQGKIWARCIIRSGASKRFSEFISQFIPWLNTFSGPPPLSSSSICAASTTEWYAYWLVFIYLYFWVRVQSAGTLFHTFQCFPSAVSLFSIIAFGDHWWWDHSIARCRYTLHPDTITTRARITLFGLIRGMVRKRAQSFASFPLVAMRFLLPAVLLSLASSQTDALKWVWILFWIFTVVTFTRFLVYNPLWGRSHVNFMGKMADVLVEAGHEVVCLNIVFESTNSGLVGNARTNYRCLHT